jgi:hypothetical protein
MVYLCKCQACGQQHRVPEARLGKKLMCTACAAVFRPSPDNAIAERPSLPAVKADRTRVPRVLKKVLGDPQEAVNGSILGSISGMIVGVVVPILAGIFSGATVGDTVGSILLGFGVGFGLGAPLGAVLGVAGWSGGPHLQSKSVIVMLVGGAVIGSLVTVLVAPYRWLPLGASLGAAGALLWPLVCSRVEAGLRATSYMTPEDDPSREDAESPWHPHSPPTGSSPSGE